MSTTKTLFVLSMALLLGLVVCSCGGLGTGDTEYSGKEIDREKLEQYGKLMQITFPETTRPLNSYVQTSGPDDAVYLKVEIDQKDLDTLISNSPFSTAEFRSEETWLQNMNTPKWWTPTDAKNFKSSQVLRNDGDVLTILVDLDNAQKPVVYLLWFET